MGVPGGGEGWPVGAIPDCGFEVGERAIGNVLGGKVGIWGDTKFPWIFWSAPGGAVLWGQERSECGGPQVD